MSFEVLNQMIDLSISLRYFNYPLGFPKQKNLF